MTVHSFFKRTFISLLTLFTILVIILNWRSLSHYYNRDFKFEKYKNAASVQEALTHLHPRGSDVDDLVKTLTIAGADVDYFETTQKKRNSFLQTIGVFKFQYDENTPLNFRRWVGHCLYNLNNKIVFIKIRLESTFK